MDMQQATEVFNKEVEAQLNKWQNETLFNKELLPANFHELLNEAFAYSTPFQLKMSLDYFKQIVEEKENEYTLMEISSICFVLKIRTADELSMDMPEYIKLQEDVEAIAKEYLSIVSGKQESIQRKVQATIKAEQGVPESHKTIAFPAQGEA